MSTETEVKPDVLSQSQPYYSYPEVFVGVPVYHGCMYQAVLGATCYTCKDPRRYRSLPMESPVLCGNFNALWCSALNTRKEIPWKYYACLHQDIFPSKWWGDTLIDEMERTGVDLLSVVIAIKDDMGLSSSAVLNKKTLCTRRLSMTEIHEYLPKTFTSKDLKALGYKDSILLHGSGMWICRFDKPWVEKLWFECPTKIVKDQAGNFISAVWDEGWNFSLQMYQMGLKIACTTITPAEHLGGGRWTNENAWGEWKTDCGNTDQSWILGRCEEKVEEVKKGIILP